MIRAETQTDLIRVDDGEQGIQGPQGPKGDTGEQGIQGPQGDDGNDASITVSKSGNTATIIATSGDGTQTTTTIIDGADGADGDDGKSAYESAVDGGYTGTEAAFNTDLADVSNKAPLTIIREYSNGVLVGKTGNTVGSLVNANGSFDVVNLSWNGKIPSTTGNSIATFGTTSRVGKSNGGHTTIDADGMRIYAGDGTLELANIGYGNGVSAQSTTVRAPYYTLGVRDTESTTLVGNYSLVEGRDNIATGYASHAEGTGCGATKQAAHAEGEGSLAWGHASHAEGYYTMASGDYSHTGGYGTIANNQAQIAIGTYNKETTAVPSSTKHSSGTVEYGDYPLIIGNGKNSSSRSNALTVDWNGNITVNNHSSPIGTIRNTYNTTDVSVPNNTAKTLCSFTLDPGTWLIECGFRSSSNGSGYRRGGCSTTQNVADMNLQMPAVSGHNTQARWTISVVITTPTTYYLTVYQNSGSTLTYAATGSGYGNFMRAIRIL